MNKLLTTITLLCFSVAANADILRDLIKEPERRSHSALRGLLDAIPEQPKPKAHQSALSGILGVQK